jgi:hypothetical protein
MITARRESPPSSLGAFGDLYLWTCTYTSDGGSADPEKNIALFNVIKKARAGGVPKANIESALQKVRVLLFVFTFYFQTTVYAYMLLLVAVVDRAAAAAIHFNEVRGGQH